LIRNLSTLVIADLIRSPIHVIADLIRNLSTPVIADLIRNLPTLVIADLIRNLAAGVFDPFPLLPSLQT
jgi:hypothetical protein